MYLTGRSVQTLLKLTALCSLLGELCVELRTDAEQYGTSEFILLMHASPWQSL